MEKKPYLRSWFTGRRLVWLGVALSFLYWTGDSLADAYLFHEGTFLDRLFPLDDPDWLLTRTLAEIERNRGVLYDPDVADACLKLFAEKRIAFGDVAGVA